MSSRYCRSGMALSSFRPAGRMRLFGAEVDDRDLRRRKKADRGGPGPRSPADVEHGAVRQAEVPAVEGKDKTGHQAEGEDLPLVGVAGELEIEGAGGVLLHDGLMLEEDSETAAGRPGEGLLIRKNCR